MLMMLHSSLQRFSIKNPIIFLDNEWCLLFLVKTSTNQNVNNQNINSPGPWHSETSAIYVNEIVWDECVRVLVGEWISD